MQEKEVIQIASEFAAQHDYAVAHYDVSAIKEGDEWQVYFQRQAKNYKPNPGDFFRVYVEDLSGNVRRIVHGK